MKTERVNSDVIMLGKQAAHLMLRAVNQPVLVIVVDPDTNETVSVSAATPAHIVTNKKWLIEALRKAIETVEREPEAVLP